jgi:hypothetical protein
MGQEVSIRLAKPAEQMMLEGAAAARIEPQAEGFYISCGFRVTGTIATRFGVGLAMRRPL